jgi:hypothetical protein
MSKRTRDGFIGAAGVVVGVGVASIVLPLLTHFEDTRNWRAGWATVGGFLVFILAMEAWRRAAHRRATGTFSYRPERLSRAWRKRQGRPE